MTLNVVTLSTFGALMAFFRLAQLCISLPIETYMSAIQSETLWMWMPWSTLWTSWLEDWRKILEVNGWISGDMSIWCQGEKSISSQQLSSSQLIVIPTRSHTHSLSQKNLTVELHSSLPDFRKMKVLLDCVSISDETFCFESQITMPWTIAILRESLECHNRRCRGPKTTWIKTGVESDSDEPASSKLNLEMNCDCASR